MEAIDRIERYRPTTIEFLTDSEERQIWFIHHLQIIGEAARSLNEDIRGEMPSVPWRQWVGLRHILVHECFGIDVEGVYGAVTNDLAALRAATLTWLDLHPEP